MCIFRKKVFCILKPCNNRPKFIYRILFWDLLFKNLPFVPSNTITVIENYWFEISKYYRWLAWLNINKPGDMSSHISYGLQCIWDKDNFQILPFFYLVVNSYYRMGLGSHQPVSFSSLILAELLACQTKLVKFHLSLHSRFKYRQSWLFLLTRLIEYYHLKTKLAVIILLSFSHLMTSHFNSGL